MLPGVWLGRLVAGFNVPIVVVLAKGPEAPVRKPG
jgi:hypothetical protein